MECKILQGESPNAALSRPSPVARGQSPSESEEASGEGLKQQSHHHLGSECLSSNRLPHSRSISRSAAVRLLGHLTPICTLLFNNHVLPALQRLQSGLHRCATHMLHAAALNAQRNCPTPVMQPAICATGASWPGSWDQQRPPALLIPRPAAPATVRLCHL